MNFLLVLTVYISLLFIIKHRISDYLSKFVVVIFTSYWCVSLAASTFSPFGLIEIHTSTYLLLLIGIIAFVLGMSLAKNKVKLPERDLSYVHNLVCSIISNKIVVLLYLLSIFYLYKYALIAIAVAAVQGHADVFDQLNLIFQGNDMAQMVYGYLLTPLFHVSLVLMSYYVLNIKRVGLKFVFQFAVYFLNLLIFIAIGGGRSTIVIVGLYLLITYAFFAPGNTLFKFSFKKAIYVVLVAGIIVYAVSLVTNYRDTGSFIAEDKEETKGQGVELLMNYSMLPYVLFDYGIQKGYLDKFGPRFGKATLMGFDQWIYIPLKVAGIPYKTSADIVEYLDDTWIPYNRDGTTANYAYTGLMYHYLDFGILGIFFFPFLFGLIFRKIIISSYKSPYFSSLLLLSMCFFLTMHAVFSCYLIKGWTGLYFVFLFFLRRMEKHKWIQRKNVLVSDGKSL